MEQQLIKKWFQKCIFLMLLTLFFIFALVWIVDPYFHFHRPFSFIKYRLYEERYINDGIGRNFDYDAIITGTSMAQNYKVSELNELFNVNAVKMTFSGAGYKEISDNIDRALTRNPGVKKVFYSMDYNGFIREKNWAGYESYPTYLYDDNPINDVAYVFNKDILFHGVLTNVVMTVSGSESTTMDEYSSFVRDTGLEHMLMIWNRTPNGYEIRPTLYGYELEYLEENINQNFIKLVNKYPDVEFYIFYTPYSICFWDRVNIDNALVRQFEAEKLVTEKLLCCSNVRLYNFNNQYDIITNLDYYSDREHYTADINSQILLWIKTGVGQINKDNYVSRLEEEINFYSNFDYDSIYH